MKYVRWMTVLIVVAFLIAVPLKASPIVEGLITETLSEEEIADLKKRNAFEKITSYSPLAVECFDVREDHMIVIGADKGNTAVIAVYDGNGNFQYGFEKETSGSFRVMWSGKNIAYYSIRSLLLFTINEEGVITDICRVASVMENSVYDQKVLESATRKVGDSTYRMTNEYAFADALPGCYKKIIKTDAQGTTVIYDASKDHNTRITNGIVLFLFISAFIAGGAYTNIEKYRKARAKKQDGATGDGTLS